MARGAAVSLLSGVVSDILSGDLGRDVAPLPFAFALRKGDAVRLMPGVPVREGGLLGLLIDGLSQEEKKSSLGSPAGVFVPVPPSLSSASSSTVTSSGYLLAVSHSLLLSQTLCIDVLPDIRLHSPRQLILILCRRTTRILHLRIFTRQRCTSSISLEELRCTLVAANFHPSKLVPLPLYRHTILSAHNQLEMHEFRAIVAGLFLRSKFVLLTKEICTPRFL